MFPIYYQKGDSYVMKKEQLQDLMTYILKKDELNRIRITTDEDGLFRITIDMHGWNVKKSKAVLNNIILLNKTAFNLDVIHGYNNGLEIKKMLFNEFSSSRIEKKRSYNENPGLTYFKFNAA